MSLPVVAMATHVGPQQAQLCKRHFSSIVTSSPETTLISCPTALRVGSLMAQSLARTRPTVCQENLGGDQLHPSVGSLALP